MRDDGPSVCDMQSSMWKRWHDVGKGCVADNGLGPEGGAAVAAALEHVKNLEHLNMAGTGYCTCIYRSAVT